ncbi:MAG: hypothetical protein VX815_03345 [Gemmatimonadota bacterium]|jgi:hypothetical protein|nr:hypothetical protein [Gemmatimonadota bacterium]
MEVTGDIASFHWTLNEVREHHLRLSREMSVEVEVVLGWDRALVTA